MVNRTLRTDLFNTANGDRPRFLNTAIVITDGQSNVDEEQTLPEATILQGFADIFVIGITNDIKYEELLVGRHDFFKVVSRKVNRHLTITNRDLHLLSVCPLNIAFKPLKQFYQHRHACRVAACR